MAAALGVLAIVICVLLVERWVAQREWSTDRAQLVAQQQSERERLVNAVIAQTPRDLVALNAEPPVREPRQMEPTLPSDLST